MKKFYASKTFLKMAGGRMHIPHPTPLDSLLAISYRNHQKNLAYFGHLAPLVLFLFPQKKKKTPSVSNLIKLSMKSLDGH